MPIHNAFSNKRRTVKLLGAGKPQFIICNPHGSPINLNPLLNDYFNHRNVVLEWEQLKGNITVLSTYDNYFSEYPFTDTSDKIFRLNIDKDTAKHQFGDFYVYHTPTSLHNTGHIVRSSAHTTATLDNVSYSDAILTGGFSRKVVPTVLGISATKFDYILPSLSTLTANSQPTKLEILYSESATHHPQQILDTLYPPYSDSYIAKAGFYKFKFYYTVVGSNIESDFTSDLLISYPKVVSLGGNEISHTVDELYSNLSTSHRDFKILRFTNIIKPLVEPNVNMSNLAYQPIPLQSITRYTNILKTTPPEILFMNSLGFKYTVQGINLIRLDQSGVGHSA